MVKEDVIYMHNIIFNLKEEKILTCMATWIDFMGIMLGEINQAVIDKYWMISLICEI